MQNQHPLHRQRGLTLVELIAALGIAAIIIAGALALYNSANDSQVATTTLQDLTAIQQAARAKYQGSYPASAETFKSDLVNIGRWPATSQGRISVSASTADAYTLEVRNLNKAVCSSLASSSKGWLAIKKEGSSISVIASNPTSTEVTAACNADNVTLQFVGN